MDFKSRLAHQLYPLKTLRFQGVFAIRKVGSPLISPLCTFGGDHRHDLGRIEIHTFPRTLFWVRKQYNHITVVNSGFSSWLTIKGIRAMLPTSIVWRQL